MEKEYLTIANSSTVWMLCSVTVAIAFLQAILYMAMARRTAVKAQIPSEVVNTSFRIGLITAIGPALGVFIVMVGLMASIGGPMAWTRLSIIGAAPTELTAATYGATAAGVKLGGEGYTMTVMAVSWFAMALNGAGWLILTGLFTPMLESLRDKMSGGDSRWLAVLSAACSLGIFGNLIQGQILVTRVAEGVATLVTQYGHATAAISGMLCMAFMVKVVVPKYPKLMEYSLGIAMLFGMFCAVIYETLTAVPQ